MMPILENELKNLYQEMYNLTRPFCGKCLVPVSCCSPEYCRMTIDNAKEAWGVELKPTEHPTLPLMGPNGCTAEPHLRPLCTLHVCSMNGLGILRESSFGPIDKEATKKYFEIRTKIDFFESVRKKSIQT